MTLDASVGVTFGGFDEWVELTAQDGEVIAVLGPNGSGKSTLLRVLAGHRPLDHGRVVLDGTVVDDPIERILVPAEHRRSALVFQEYLLFPHLSALGNVAFGLRRQGLGRRDAARSARSWLERLGLSDRIDARPSELSGGQAQRVALARALATRPRVLLLDEPMAALDADVRGDVRQQLRSELASFAGSSILVTHDPLDAAVLADRMVILEGGHVVQEGTFQAIASRPVTPYVASLVGLNLLGATAAGTHLTLANGVTLHAAERLSGDVLAVIPPQSVALSLEHHDGSERNQWRTTVLELHRLGERTRVVLGEPIPLTIEVTTVSIAELRIAEGSTVWASVKATQITTYAGTVRR